ncbi:hypothetical protein QBC44DRAFT_384353 [Cladorrhinum sp. PSN332]|nr:hypothetical protein QBC44DRAFT_384353 [Cladorrhinum sp. PSN332]
MLLPPSFRLQRRDSSESSKGLTSAQTAAIIVFSLLIGLGAICTTIWCRCCRGRSPKPSKGKRKGKVVRMRATRSESPPPSDSRLDRPPPMGFSGAPGPAGPPPIVVVGEGPRWSPGTFVPGLDPRRSGVSVPVVVPGREGIHTQSGMMGFEGRGSLERMESRSRGSSMSQPPLQPSLSRGGGPAGEGGVRRPPPVVYYADHRLQVQGPPRDHGVESPLPRQGTLDLGLGGGSGRPPYQESSEGNLSDGESGHGRDRR